MTRFKLKYHFFISFLFLHSKAGANYIDNYSKKINNSENHQNLKISEVCSRLLVLENKVDLSEKDIEIGYLVHELVSNVSSSPLEYCDDILAQVKKETVEDITSYL